MVYSGNSRLFASVSVAQYSRRAQRCRSGTNGMVRTLKYAYVCVCLCPRLSVHAYVVFLLCFINETPLCVFFPDVNYCTMAGLGHGFVFTLAAAAALTTNL